MKTNLKATNIKLTTSIRNYLDKKIGGLQKFLKGFDNEAIEISIEVGKNSQHHRHGDIFYAEVNISLPGKLIRAKVSSSDIYASIDQAKDELQREIKKYKEKKMTKDRRRGRSFKKARALSPLARFRKK